MKQFYILLTFLLVAHIAAGQWTKVSPIPSVHIVAFGVHNSNLYVVSDSNLIYKSEDGGNWTRLTLDDNSIDITAIGFLNNTIYIGTARSGIFSSDDGLSWQHSPARIFAVSSFAVKNGILYAATLGDGVVELNAATNNWSAVNNNLPSYSVNVQNIISSPTFLIIGAGANGTFYRFNFVNNSWEENLYFGRLRPGLLINRLITVGNTIFATNTNHTLRSNDNGSSWTEDAVGTHTGDYRVIYAAASDYYTLTDVFPQGTWIQHRSKDAVTGSTWAHDEEFLPTGFSYDIVQFGEKLFMGRADGLYVKNLQTSAPPPTRFVAFNTSCTNHKTTLSWETTEEKNTNHYDIERTEDSHLYTVIGQVAGVIDIGGNGSYVFIDNVPLPTSSYRIAGYDADGKVHYTTLLSPHCAVMPPIGLSPNPANDIISISLVAEQIEQLEIRLVDSKGSTVKMQRAGLVPGSNGVGVDVRSLSPGIYYVSLRSASGRVVHTGRFIKL